MSDPIYLYKVGYIQTSGKFGHKFANSINPDQDFHCLLG